MPAKPLVRINEGDVRKLLLSASSSRREELSALLDSVNPVWLLDRESDDVSFEARLGHPNEIRMGLKCSKRIQVHAYAAAVILGALNRPREERQRMLVPVDEMLNWAVGAELSLTTHSQAAFLPPDHVLRKTDDDIPDHVLAKLTLSEKAVGQGLYRYSICWILLHELCHLNRGHTPQRGLVSWAQEKEADRFAAEWMLEAASDVAAHQRGAERLCALLGISVPLLWLTVVNVFLGTTRSPRHPEGYDRLYQVLDQVIDQRDVHEHNTVWACIATLLFIHMDSAGFDFGESDASYMQGDPRDEVNHLITRIEKGDRRR
jgi:hypothetical protein